MFSLKRTYLEKATHGELFYKGQKISETIELSWNHNKKRISCIPEGTYKLRKRYSEKFKWHYVLLHVPDRSYILIHPANNALKELQGCIAPVIKITGMGVGIESRKALGLFTEYYDKAKKSGPVYLVITNKRNEVEVTL